MKGGSKLFLVAGVGLAIVAIGLLFMGMSGGGKKTDANQPETKPENVTVVQAAVAIPAHTMLKASDLIEVKMSATDAPADAVKSTSEVLNFSYRVPLAQGQTLLKTQTEQPGIRNDIEQGKRAASIPVDEVSLLSGLVQDGDYVDVVFHARLDLVRLLPTTLAETPEDTLYKYSGGGGGNGNGSGGSGDNNGDNNGDDDDGSVTAAQGGPIMWIPAGMEYITHPATGDPGSRFYIRDAGDNLEPVAKVIIQDVKVLRVVRAGESFAADGTLGGQAIGGDAPAQADEKSLAHLILQVTPEQAEVLTFIQDAENQHKYQVVVRGKDDHEQVDTTGITFQILATDEQWMLPWPQTVVAPKTQAKPKSTTTRTDNQDDEADATPDAEASPAASNP
jgi:Flp pilus assembly protein CpaB